MPRLALIQDAGVVSLKEEPFLGEARLQRLLEENPELIALDEVDSSATLLIPIGSEVSLGGQALDLLFIDAAGRLTAVEAKLRKNSQVRREVVGQTLEYISYLSTWTIDDVERQAASYFSSESTPARFRDISLHSAMCSSMGADDSNARPDEDDVRARVADKLGRKDLCAIIAVDRVVDPLRRIVTFLNRVSSVSVLLLEVLEYRAPDGTRLASINIYGGPERRPTRTSLRGAWDTERFLAKLQVHASPQSVPIAERLSQFIQEQADSPVWGSGLDEGSVGFGIRRGGARFTVFGVTTRGQVYLGSGALRRHVASGGSKKLVESLRQIEVKGCEHFLDSDAWLSFDAELLAGDERFDAFTNAVLAIRDTLGVTAP